MTNSTRSLDVATRSTRKLAGAVLLMIALALVGLATSVTQGLGLQNPAATGTIPVYAPMTAKPRGPIAPRPNGYKVDAIEFLLIPMQTVEYKYRLERGATMIYSWTANGRVRFDFHTVPDGKPLSASQRFEAAEKDQAHGVYTAPYSGLHGWWWENRGNESVTIRLTTAGFYTAAIMFSDGEQTPFTVKDPPPPEEP